MKTFNNTHGTTASEYAIGVGSAEARNIVLTAVCESSDVEALDKQAMPIEVSGIAFYDMRVIAKNAQGHIAAKQLRGTINTTVTRIEDIFQEEFPADVVLTSNGTTLTVTCKNTGSLTNYTIYTTIINVDI